MSDLVKYIEERKIKDKEFKEGFDSGYNNFKKDVPNKKTIKAMENVRMGKDLKEVTLEELEEEAKKCLLKKYNAPVN